MSFLVTTEAGVVAGHAHPSNPHCAVFSGIPYAAAPVGPLYLREPQPHPGWEGVRDCSGPAPTPQRRPYSEDSLFVDPSIPGDDYLNLTIWTPTDHLNSSPALPVLVWIHGGGFKAGVAASALTDGEAFVRDGIVVVAFSYRLGFEGFGSIDDAAPNRGFLDQQAALAWIQRNIAAFGGDPTRVTIAGQSAGGGSVLAHLTCPSSQGLFSRAISMSGVLPAMSAETAHERSLILCNKLGVRPVRSELATISTEALTAAEIETEREIFSQITGPVTFLRDRLDGIPMSDLPFTPWIDGEIIPASILDSAREGIGDDVPLLATVTSEEFTDILTVAAADRGINDLDPVELLRMAGFEERGFGDPALYVAAHPRATTTELVMGQVVTDAIFTHVIEELAAIRCERDAALTRLATFTWCPAVAEGEDALDPAELTRPMEWARHCMDIPFVWRSIGHPMAQLLVGPRPPQSLSDEWHGLWVDWINGQ